MGQGFRIFQTRSKNAIKCLIEHSDTFTFRDQDRVQYIRGCELFQDWFSKQRSSAIYVRAEAAPDEIVNFMSVNTAEVALTMGGWTGVIVLSCFCSLREKASLLERESGSLGILKAPIGQLLKIMLKKQSVIDFPFHPDDKLWIDSTGSFKYSCVLLRKLLVLLPSGNVVFVFLDSIPSVLGDESLVNDLARMIPGVCSRKTSIVIRQLFTEPVPSSSIWKMAHLYYSLHVADDFDGWECGMNTGSIRETASKPRRVQ